MSNKRLDEYFSVSYGNKLDLNKMSQLSTSSGGINFVGRSSENHGVSATIAPIKGIEPFPAGVITVALGGTKLLSSFVQEHPFYTAQNVAVLTPKVALTFEQKLYICLAIRHNRFRYSAFGREANRTIKSLQIPSLVDFPPWLGSAADAAQAPLLSFLAPLKTKPKPPKGRLPMVGADRVPIDSLFSAEYGTNLELNRLEKDPSGINFVSRTSRNNGVSAKVSQINSVFPTIGPALSVAGGGSVLETFVQLDPFYTGRDMYVLKPLAPMTNDELLFYCYCIRANKFRYSYGRQANRTLRKLLVPARAAIPSWVYGGFERVIAEVEAEIETGAKIEAD